MGNVKIGLADATIFKDSISTINGLVTEANIVLNDEGLSIICLDPANVALCAFKMSKSEFLEWTVNEDTEIGVKLSDLKQVLSRGDKNSTLYLSSVNDKLNVAMIGKNGKKKEFNLGIIAPDGKKQKVPDLKFTVELVIDNMVLKDGIADVAVVAESVAFNIADKKFNISGAGDINNANSEMDSIVTIYPEAGFKSKYSIEYLDKFTSCKLSKNVKIGFGKDYPVKFSYVNDKGTISMIFVVAPRIENN